MNAYDKDIPIANLYLDLQNPRHEPVHNQREALESMLADDPMKTLRLAEHIVANGVNPADRPIVIPYEGDGDDDPGDTELFTMLEGNRRLTAFHLLEEPSRIPRTLPASIQKRFRELAAKYDAAPLSDLPCVVFPDRQTANPWIRLKHTGENDGVGTWQWGSKEKQRFNKQEFGKKSPALQVLELMEAHGNLSADAKAKLANFPITNLTRFLNDLAVREFLGIEIDEGDIYTTLPSREVLKPLRRVVTDLATGRVNVNHIRSKKDRAKYIEGFADTELPDTSKAAAAPSIFGSDLSGAPMPKSGKPAAKVAASKGSRSKPRSTTRAAIIPRGCVIRPTEQRINDIYIELKDLRVDDLPNAGAIMLRIFLELCVDSYLTRNKLGLTAQDKLNKKLEAVKNDLKARKIMTDKELKPINVALANKDDLVSIDTLHAYVHNYQFTPKPDDLKITWDRLELFMKKVWE